MALASLQEGFDRVERGSKGDAVMHLGCGLEIRGSLLVAFGSDEYFLIFSEYFRIFLNIFQLVPRRSRLPEGGEEGGRRGGEDTARAGAGEARGLEREE